MSIVSKKTLTSLANSGASGSAWISKVEFTGSFDYLHNMDHVPYGGKIVNDGDNIYYTGSLIYTNASPSVPFATLLSMSKDGSHNWGKALGTNTNSNSRGFYWYDLAIYNDKLYTCGQLDEFSNAQYFFGKFDSSDGSIDYAKFADSSGSYSSGAHKQIAISTDGSKMAIGGVATSSELATVNIFTTNDHDEQAYWYLSSPSNAKFYGLTWISSTELVIFAGRNDKLYVTRVSVSGTTVYSISLEGGSNVTWGAYDMTSNIEYDGTYAYISGINNPGSPINDRTLTVLKLRLSDGVIIWEKYYKIYSGVFNMKPFISLNSENGDIYVGVVLGYTSSKLLRLDNDGNLISAHANTTSGPYGYIHALHVDGEGGQIYASSGNGTVLAVFTMPTDVTSMENLSGSYAWTNETSSIEVLDKSEVSSPVTRTTEPNWVRQSSGYPSIQDFEDDYPYDYERIVSDFGIASFEEVEL